MDHVPHGPEHDADVAARGAAEALTGAPAPGLGGRKLAALLLFDVAAFLAVLALAALSAWQVGRRAWKLDLIARVEARIHAGPVAAPGPERWAALSAATDEYRRVSVSGTWLPDRTVLVHALTVLGGGSWVLTPLARPDGTVVLVNRGFVPEGRGDPTPPAPPAGPATVTGLLRMTEPGGAFLRANEPAAGRWYSRDVGAIAASKGLAPVAPFFVDAERASDDPDGPVGGLTVVTFSNNHLVYAVTWAALAAMAAAGVVFVHVDVVRRSNTLRVSPPV